MELKKTKKPYYEVTKNISQQIKSGSRRKKQNQLTFLYLKVKNFILEMLAYNCPFNSLRVKFHRWRGVNIGQNVMIGLKVTLDHSYPEMIVLEDDVSLAGNNYLLAHSNPYPHFAKVIDSYAAPVVIKKGAWLGIGAMVLPDVVVGEYSIIAAGSVVTKSIPDMVIAGGMPAKVLKDIKDLVGNSIS
jgi:acetyltransferase-like isoleucine patch superfamily enzyme